MGNLDGSMRPGDPQMITPMVRRAAGAREVTQRLADDDYYVVWGMDVGSIRREHAMAMR